MRSGPQPMEEQNYYPTISAGFVSASLLRVLHRLGCFWKGPAGYQPAPPRKEHSLTVVALTEPRALASGTPKTVKHPPSARHRHLLVARAAQKLTFSLRT